MSDSLVLPPLTESEKASLTQHELKVMALITSLAGKVQGFPDHERKLYNVTKTWAKFMSLEPYHVRLNPQVAEFMSDKEKAAYAWKEGVIPGEWLVSQIADSCEWMPAPVVAREIYLSAGFPPLDGRGLDQLSQIGRRRDVRPADTSFGDAA